MRVRTWTHHIDGGHGPDAVDINTHVDDCWLHCGETGREKDSE